MKHMKMILAAVMVVGMGRMLVLYTTNPPVPMSPKDLWQEGGDLLYPPMGKKEDYAKAREILEKVAAQEDDRVSAADALADLAEIYKEGFGVGKDEARARHYFEQALSTYKELIANAERNPKAAAFANFQLGHIYESHENSEGAEGQYAHWVKPDEERSRNYFEQARILFEQVVDQYDDLESVAEANIALGHLYEVGHLGDADWDKAQIYYDRVAHNKQIPLKLSIDAYFALAQMYEYGEGAYDLGQDIEKSMNYYNRIISLAQQAGRLESAYRARMGIGDIYVHGVGQDGPDFIKAQAEYQKIGQLANAQQGIAYLYRYGQGDTFPKDIKRAETYYRSAIANQNASEEQKKLAREDLAGMFSELGSQYYQINIDYALARQYFNKVLEIEGARSWNERMAHDALGKMSYEGQGGPKDYAEARDHFNKVIADKEASNWDKVTAQAYMGRIYYDERNYIEAAILSQRALGVANGPLKEQAIAQYTLGMMYYFGRGLPVDRNIAKDYFALVVDNDYADAAEKLSAQEMLEAIEIMQNPNLMNRGLQAR